jgi:hypothetical protein
MTGKRRRQFAQSAAVSPERVSSRRSSSTDPADLPRRSGPGSLDDTAKGFAESLKRRGHAARGLEKDLLNEVPLLYGSPGDHAPYGDAGIVLAKIHRETLVRRNGGGVPDSTHKPSHAALPLERTMAALVILLCIVFFSGVLD